MRHLLKASVAATALLVSAPAIAQDTFAIINAKVVTNTDTGNGDNLTVLVENGKIQAIGRTDTSANAPKPNGTTIIDGTGKWVTPGIFVAASQIGMVEVGAEASTNDVDADDGRNSVGLKAADSFNPKSTTIPSTRMEGVTHAAILGGMGNSIFGGTGAIIDTSGGFDSVINGRAFVYATIGERGAREAGGSRAAALNELRNALGDAARYPSRYGSVDDGDSISRSDAAALVPVVKGQIPLILQADRASDIMAAIKLKSQFKALNIYIMGGTEGWMVADEMAKAKVSVIIDPTESLPRNFESVGTRLDNANLLKAAGVRMAFMPRTSGFSHEVRLLPQHAGNAVANGLPWADAFRAITLTPAQMFGQADAGKLSVGKTANLVIWDGDPLEVMSAPTRIVIDGEVQDMTSRQTKLRDRYNPTHEDDRPHKYR